MTAKMREIIGIIKSSLRKKKKIAPVRELAYLSKPIFPKNDVIAKSSGIDITWIVPPFSAGSGGHATIFRFISLLAEQGLASQIVVMDGAYFGGVEKIQELIWSSFDHLRVPVYVDLADCPVSEITIATGWVTAYLLKNYRAKTKPVYFVQDFEPWFVGRGSKYQLAENTYRFGFPCVTAGTWLQNTLSADYGLTCSSFSFSYDPKIYHTDVNRKYNGRTVFFYARPSTERRAFDFGLLVLDGVARKVPNLQVVFAGQDLSSYDIPFRHSSRGLLQPEALAKVYHECDLALVLSFTNISLLPFEIMACGTPVITNGGPWVEWLLSPDICQICEADVEMLVDQISDLIVDEGKLKHLAERALEHVRMTDWKVESAKIAKSFRGMLQE